MSKDDRSLEYFENAAKSQQDQMIQEVMTKYSLSHQQALERIIANLVIGIHYWA